MKNRHKQMRKIGIFFQYMVTVLQIFGSSSIRNIAKLSQPFNILVAVLGVLM